MVFAADEYYLLADTAFPEAEAYEGFPMHEDGVGMASSFALEFAGAVPGRPATTGFFRSVDGAPAEGYRVDRLGTPAAEGSGGGTAVAVKLQRRVNRNTAVTVLTGDYGAAVLRPILDAHGYHDVEVLAVPNRYFGGTTAVTGLLTGGDLSAALAGRDPNRRYLLPDVCLSGGRFLDDTSPADLPVDVEVIGADGASLRAALGPASGLQ
jgi:NifB/MoaA-like Fe-S oxidoreductase